MDTIAVNGPEDVLDWDAVDWRTHENNVARLRRRIFTATREQDWATARSLQKMMVHSWSNTLLSVRQVTQRNAGRRTAGIDGEVALSSPERAEMVVRVHRSRSSWDPLPVRARRVWILDADLSAAFDRIDHAHILGQLGAFPARELVAGWLRAGVIEAGRGFAPTEAGTPQGGVISPLLMNVALHGLEDAAGVRYHATGTRTGNAVEGTPILVRYADDMVVCCYSQQQTEQVKAKLADWLAPRGLAFNEDKTRIVALDDGFDFLGFNLRRYRYRHQPAKLLIKPSPEAVRRIRHRLADELHNLRGSNAMAVIARLNPITRGWAAYYRGVVSSKVFASLDNHLWWLTYRWARHSHPNKPKKWIARRHFGRFNKFRNDHWVFGARDHVVNDRGDVAFLVKFSWTAIVRHQLVTGGASPDDPHLIDYWAARRRKVKPPLDGYNLRLLAKQDGRCPLCGDHLLVPDQPPQSPPEWERWWLSVARRAIAADHLTHHGRGGALDGNRTRLVHTSCHRSLQLRQRRNPTPPSPATPTGLLEPRCGESPPARF